MAPPSASRLPTVALRGSRTIPSTGNDREAVWAPKPIGFRHNIRASENGRLMVCPRIDEFRGQNCAVGLIWGNFKMDRSDVKL
ncbi:hypothetical protein, partial [uncultured Gimesia sp.]|uniref:hypothetical protein n=1 Tax=uncultured Gimesia sp. TaxID=1678688 RepID=UPI00260B5C30